MAHECEQCGQQCYCDMEDTGGFEQPIDCPHFLSKEACDAHPDWQIDVPDDPFFEGC